MLTNFMLLRSLSAIAFHIKQNKYVPLSIPSSNQRDVTADWPIDGAVHAASHSQRGVGAAKRIETKDLKEWGLQTDFKETGNCKLNCQEFPAWNVVTKPRAKIPKQMRS